MTEVQSPNLTEILRDLLKHIGLDVSVTPRTEGNTLFLKVEGPDTENARGKKGEVLDALQYILGKVLGNAEQPDQKVSIDIGDFRAGREDSISELGRFLIEKSLKLQKTIAIHPMGSADRKVIHSAVQSDGRASSQSEGDGMARRLFIIPQPKVARPERPPRRADDRPSDERGPRRTDDRGPRDDRPRDERPREDRGPRRADDRPREDRGPRPPRNDRGPRRESPMGGPPLGTPENPYVMEAPPEPPEDK
jgi:spoIIIJ-associated protein